MDHNEVVPARVVALLMIPVCPATFSYASDSSDSHSLRDASPFYHPLSCVVVRPPPPCLPLVAIVGMAHMAARKTESRTVLFGDGTSTDLAGFWFAKETRISLVFDF